MCYTLYKIINKKKEIKNFSSLREAEDEFYYSLTRVGTTFRSGLLSEAVLDRVNIYSENQRNVFLKKEENKVPVGPYKLLSELDALDNMGAVVWLCEDTLGIESLA